MQDCYVLEKQVQILLNKEYLGELEKEIPVGRIDILAKNFLIEIKTTDKWKEGIGQLFTYECYLDKPRQKVLVLFGFIEDRTLLEIRKVCEKLNIELRLISPEIKLNDVTSLSNEYNYLTNDKLSCKQKKKQRIDTYLENIDKEDCEIVKFLLELEPNSSNEALAKWVKRQRNKYL